MEKSKIFVFAAYLGIIITVVPLAAETFQYHETVERGEEYTSRWIIEEKNGQIHLTILNDNPNQLYTCICTPDGSVVELNILDPDTETDLLAWREGNTINLVGSANGDKHNKKIKVEDLPWGNPIPILLKRQYQKLAGGLDFIMLDIYKGRPLYLQAKKVNTGPIEVLGKEYPAHHIEIRLRGALSPFWVSSYWIHARTREFLKFDGDFGPGSPKTVMQLMKVY